MKSKETTSTSGEDDSESAPASKHAPPPAVGFQTSRRGRPVKPRAFEDGTFAVPLLPSSAPMVYPQAQPQAHSSEEETEITVSTEEERAPENDGPDAEVEVDREDKPFVARLETQRYQPFP